MTMLEDSLQASVGLFWQILLLFQEGTVYVLLKTRQVKLLDASQSDYFQQVR